MARQVFLRYKYGFSHSVENLGERHIPDYWQATEGSKVSNSYVLFCPKCGEIWGRITHEHPSAYCQPVTSYCPDHMVFASDGTFSSNVKWAGDPRDSDGMPEAALKHDVISLCTYFINNPKRAILLL